MSWASNDRFGTDMPVKGSCCKGDLRQGAGTMLPDQFLRKDAVKAATWGQPDGIGQPGSWGQLPCVSVTGGTTTESVNTIAPIIPIPGGVVAKFPVVLAELTVQINVDSTLTLPEPAFEIKRIKKRVKITQCILLQDTNVLFIKGFIRKNIEFTTRGQCNNSTGFCSKISQCTIDVPFTTTTTVTFNGIAPLRPVLSTNEEFVYFRVQDISGPEFAEKDQLLSSDLSEHNQISTEFFNELPFCELISARIVEFDEQLNPTKPYCGTFPFEEKEFRSIEEKMVIFLTLKLLQNRQVAIPPVAGGFQCTDA